MTRTVGTTRYAPTPSHARRVRDPGGGLRIVEFGVRLDAEPGLCADPEYDVEVNGVWRLDRLWFDDSIGGGGRAQAMAICFRCPIRQACYDYAENTGQNVGIWGGVDMGQAARLRRAADGRAAWQRTREVAADG
jgi:hypothetical protein